MYIGLYKVYLDDGFEWWRAYASYDRSVVAEFMEKRYVSGSFKIVKV